MNPIHDNPFAVLTAIVAPAILTNASSVLCLNTSNRIARVVDRSRSILSEVARVSPDSPEYRAQLGQLERQKARASLLLRALRLFYASLGAFAASALISVLGSAMAFYAWDFFFRASAVVALAAGVFAVSGLVIGCVLLVRETRIAVFNLDEEAEIARMQFLRDRPPTRI